MRRSIFIVFILIFITSAFGLLSFGCEGVASDSGGGGDAGSDTDADTDTDTDADGDSDTDTDGDSDTDTDTDSDSDGDTDTDADGDAGIGSCTDADGDGWCVPFDCNDGNALIHPGASELLANSIDDDCDGTLDEPSTFGGETITGTVMAPQNSTSANFPISGALVYVTYTLPEAIPDTAFCYECENMGARPWTLSNADGTFEIDNAPAGTMYLVTRKGAFRRVREITIAPGVPLDVSEELTTLPNTNSADGRDEIPNYAVMQSGPDYVEDMLAKMGLGELSGGSLDESQTFNFDMYDDSTGAAAGGGASGYMFSSQAHLNSYHMIFFPCISNPSSMSGAGSPTAKGFISMIQSYFAAGGKLYASCWGSQWVEQPFPDVIDFHGTDEATSSHPGNVGSYDTTGVITDDDMRDWLTVVNGSDSLDAYPFSGAWINMDNLTTGAYAGHGLDETGGLVVPKVWVEDLGYSSYSAAGDPLTITFNYDCGKAFYSSYQVVESATSNAIRAQEWVLIYLFFEVGVCEGDYGVE